MPAAKRTMIFEQGSDFDLPMQFSTGGTIEDGGTPIDLTGFTARMHVRQKVTSDDTLVELTTENGRIDIFDAEDGWLRLQVEAADTEAMTWKSGVYDLELVSPSGYVRRYLYGPAKLSLEVTRD